MAKYLVQYIQVQEVTYTDWVEADSEEEALKMVEDNPNFGEEVDSQGIDLKDFEVIDKE